MGLNKIAEMRKTRGWTIDELSDRSGVPVSTIKKISAGITKRPNIETVKAIVHAMGFTLDDLDDESVLEEKKISPSEATVPEEDIIKDDADIYEAVEKFATKNNIDQKRIEKAIRILEILLFDD